MSKFFIFLLLTFGLASIEAQTHVLVSIAPQKFLVEQIGGEYVTVDVIVPAGASSHTYEPSPRQTVEAQNAEVWFRLGESFEKRMVPLFQNKMQIVDQREGLELITSGCSCCHTTDAHDPHIWLSPRLLKQQAVQIAHTLSERHPNQTDYFEQNLSKLLNELTQLDQECMQLFSANPQKMIMVSHPAFGYFCRDYGLTQLSIEMEGREPTTKYLLDLIDHAGHNNIHTVFLQSQHNPKGGKRVAKELHAKTVFLDPYQENVVDNLRNLATLFSQQ